jgi:predicted Co/Zn/Cd cation transporter (cation efflux family)
MSLLDVENLHCAFSYILGGVIYPLIYSKLFPEVGFPWDVHISAFVYLGCLCISWFTVTSRLSKRKPGPFVDVESLKDVNFLLLSFGTFVAVLGKWLLLHLMTS